MQSSVVRAMAQTTVAQCDPRVMCRTDKEPPSHRNTDRRPGNSRYGHTRVRDRPCLPWRDRRRLGVPCSHSRCSSCVARCRATSQAVERIRPDVQVPPWGFSRSWTSMRTAAAPAPWTPFRSARTRVSSTATSAALHRSSGVPVATMHFGTMTLLRFSRRYCVPGLPLRLARIHVRTPRPFRVGTGGVVVAVRSSHRCLSVLHPVYEPSKPRVTACGAPHLSMRGAPPIHAGRPTCPQADPPLPPLACHACLRTHPCPMIRTWDRSGGRRTHGTPPRGSRRPCLWRVFPCSRHARRNLS